MEFLYYPDEIASALYKLASDQDFNDYTETQRQEVEQITDCLYQLKAICENKYNNDYYRTFYKCLERITDINY